jgi:hypothetical protein
MRTSTRRGFATSDAVFVTIPVLAFFAQVNPPDITQDFSAWAFQQGALFVLLVFIFYGGWRAFKYLTESLIPLHIKSIHDGYERIADMDRQKTEIIAKAFEASEKRTQEQVRELIAKIDRFIEGFEKKEWS